MCIFYLLVYLYAMLAVAVAGMVQYPDDKVDVRTNVIYLDVIEKIYERAIIDESGERGWWIRGISVGLAMIVLSVAMVGLGPAYDYGYGLGIKLYPNNLSIGSAIGYWLPVIAVFITAGFVITLIATAYQTEEKKVIKKWRIRERIESMMKRRTFSLPKR